MTGSLRYTHDSRASTAAPRPGLGARPFRLPGVRLIGASVLAGLLAVASPVVAQSPDTPSITAPPAASGGLAVARRPVETHPAPRPATPVEAPTDYSDPSAWMIYKTRSERPALPEAARIFYRHGLLARREGKTDEAIRLIRGASELDPTFVDPHRTLIQWLLFREPGQALVQCAALVELLRKDFLVQITAVANGLCLLVQILFLALLAAGLVIVGTRNQQLRHGVEERLARLLGARAARKWPWIFLAAPYLFGLGLALPTVFFLALLWPTVKLRERTLFVALLGLLFSAPWITAGMDRLARPLGDDQAPFYGVLRYQNQTVSAAQRQRLEALADAQPDQPFVQFGRGWVARQSGDLATAEAAYRRAMALWPGDDRVLNNLANTLALQGHQDQAIELYRKAIAAHPASAPAYFNMAQAYTRAFDFHAATEALSHASSLDFEMVSSHQAQTTEDRPMPLVEQWIAPERLWNGLLHDPIDSAAPALLPPAWRGRAECSGWSFSIVALLCAGLGLALGWLQHRSLPLRRCGNCDRVVCRRCAQRRREIALCRSCAAVEARAKAPDFARVLLLEHRRKVHGPMRIARTVAAIVIPGFGLLSLRRVFTPLVLLAVAAGLASVQLHGATPFAFQPGLGDPGPAFPALGSMVPWIFVYACSILGYFTELRRQDARAAAAPRPARGRSGPPPHQVAAAA